MPITTHVTSLELSRRLKELGVEKESLFYWVQNRQTAFREPRVLYNPQILDWNNDSITGADAFQYDRLASAYLASELGEMLPDIITGEHLYSYQQARNWSDKRLPKHRLVYWFAGEIELYRVDADTECNCRAKMLIHLLENHLISVEELGK